MAEKLSHFKDRAEHALQKYRRIFIVLFHAGLIASAYLLGFYIRFDFDIPSAFFPSFWKTLPLLLAIKVVTFYYFGLFHGLWRYSSVTDLWQIIKGSCVANLLFIACYIFAFGHQSMPFPRSVFILDWIICTMFLSGVRFASRLLRDRYRSGPDRREIKVLIIGAGDAGVITLREYRSNPDLGQVVGFIDDDPVKRSGTIHGVKIIGRREDIQQVVARHGVDEVVIAIPSASGETIREIISHCQVPGLRMKIVPRLEKIISGDLVVKPREVKAEDLLGRETVSINEQEVSGYVRGKRVLVTGAGGSIGSEICRQVARFEPTEVVLLDHNENDVYFLLIEFQTRHKDVKISTVIGDIKDVSLLIRTFSRFRPQVVFHAAAHKHVPLMEENPVAAVKNNIIGSRNLIYAAHHYGVERFVLISTDKAVNPINVMGMSKRISEMMLQSKAKASKTKFMAVRFGNVIGSSGSVVPLFKRQIEEGGPLTVTHPETRRYFMSVKEAVLLVLQAGFIGKGGEIFILDMGEQIKVLDIAKDLITLSGYTLDRDIRIHFTGLRPGEKLFEELLLDKEKDRVTKHNKIYVSHSDSFDPQRLRGRIKELEHLARVMDDQAIVSKMNEIIADHETLGDEPALESSLAPAVSALFHPEPDPI